MSDAPSPSVPPATPAPATPAPATPAPPANDETPGSVAVAEQAVTQAMNDNVKDRDNMKAPLSNLSATVNNDRFQSLSRVIVGWGQ